MTPWIGSGLEKGGEGDHRRLLTLCYRHGDIRETVHRHYFMKYRMGFKDSLKDGDDQLYFSEL